MASEDRRAARARRLRRSYELGQLSFSVLATLPIAAIAGFAIWLSNGSHETTLAALVTVTLGLGLAWSGRDRRRAIPAGVVAGTIPLGAAFAGHFLGASWLEQPAWLGVLLCVVGGAVGNWALHRWVKGSPRTAGLVLPASALTMAVGSMGCVVAGAEEVLAMLIGFFAATSGRERPFDD